MLKHFSTIARIKGAPLVTVNFDGTWKNELHSEMDLEVDDDGFIVGTYRTGVGMPGPAEEFDLAGFASGDLLSFTVNFGKYGSLTSWAGQYAVENGKERIQTMWLLAKNVQDDTEVKSLWGTTLIGADRFSR